ncbi:fused MFS/spermidine synthase [soil metagenome]
MASIPQVIPVRHDFLKARYVATIGISSFLLFLIEPMIARMALPRLGGAPAVWNSAMLVYQALLLAGYSYAHWIGRFAGKKQAVIHIFALALAALMLPLGLSSANPPADANAFIWAPWLLLTSIGPVFFVIAAQAPLIQRWFSASGGGNPYYLYAASNLGSFAGLLAYPLLVEPLLSLKQQSLLWTAGYILLAVMVAACALALPRESLAEPRPVADSPATPRRTLFKWLLLAAVPSGLMLSTTTHITSDIVAMPLLWVLPLGLYLLSFSVAFAENRKLATGISAIAGLVILIGGGSAFGISATQPAMFAFIGLTLLFVLSVTLHTALYDSRPHESRLTEFYLVMSLGGVVGGLFCALIAPLIFDWGYEHPILILVAALIIPQRALFQRAARFWQESPRARTAAIVIPVVALITSFVSEFDVPDGYELRCKAATAILLIGLALFSLGKRVSFTIALAALMMTLGGWQTLRTSLAPDARSRSYFGINTVGTDPDNSRYLLHGTTLHGVQLLTPGHEKDRTTYYAPVSGVGEAFTAVPALFGPRARVGVVGLGAGVLACYKQAGQDWRFYEIDPAVVEIARNPRQFTFLLRCAPTSPVEIGDARLLLAHDNVPKLDVLTIDAFSADSIPVHLLTGEAFELYRKRLTPNGLLLINISSRFMNLEPVIAAARGAGWHGSVREYRTVTASPARHYTSSVWVALSRDPATIATLVRRSPENDWRPLKERPGFTRWTDDYASVLPLLIFSKL